MQLLTEETWRQLDPYAGRLSRRDLRRAVIAAVGVVLLLAAGAAVATSGLLVPTIGLGNARGHNIDPGTRLVNYDFEVVNRGRFPVEITDVGRPGPGLELLSYPAGEDPAAAARTSGWLRPGERMALGLAYRITDCHAVPAEPWPVPVRIARPWGTQTIWIGLPTETGPDFSGAHDEAPWRDTDEEVEWQRNIADLACR